MHLKLQFAALVTSIAAAILLAGCPPPTPPSFTSFAYTGPLLPFGVGGTSPICQTCFIKGTFTVNSPLGFNFAPGYTTYDLKANGRIASFDFTVSGWTLGGTPPEYSNTNGAIIVTFGVTGLDSSGNLGNWNIEITDSGRKTFIATCNASAAFMAQHPGTNPSNAGFPSGAACTTPAPTKDDYSGGGNTLLQGNGPGVMTGM
jgi:hypothetical protein